MIQQFNIKLDDRKFDLHLALEPEQFYSDAVLAATLPRSILPEPEVIHAMAQILKRGDCCVDAGANIGFFTILMSKLVGPDGKVIAIEPDLRNIDKLRKNLDINECTNVRIVPWPICARVEERSFHTYAENGSSTLYAGFVAQAGKLVNTAVRNCDTLAELIKDHKIQPTLLKMDIEGAELEAITGCSYKIPFVISEINEEALGRAGASIEKLRFHFENLWGYATHILSDTGSMPARLANTTSQKIVPARPNTNVLFAREWDVIKAWPEVKV